MANITKVYTPANIFQGPADIYINIAAPASSLTPSSDSQTLTLDANGQPSSATGFHAGLVEAPTMPTITEKLNPLSADQIETPIDVALDSIEAEIDIVLKETNLSRLSTLLTSSQLNTYTALGTQQVLQMGGQLNSNATSITITAIAPRRDAPTKFVYWMLYKAYLMSSIQMQLQRTKETVYKLKFKGIADTTRVSGDELMQIVRNQ
jgi:hypothetical protein